MKVAIYARYSSDNQRDASIADQMRVCRAFAERQGWTISQEYADHALSGATLLRSGFQALMRDALNRRFDVVLAESLDRFSRDQEDTAGLFKRLTFAGVNITTLAEGDITHLHIGFKGTMNALFLKDLAEKNSPRPARPNRGRKVGRRSLLRLSRRQGCSTRLFFSGSFRISWTLPGCIGTITIVRAMWCYRTAKREYGS
jgi:DNA invertase Pin-like site-specific DNA recombinase